MKQYKKKNLQIDKKIISKNKLIYILKKISMNEFFILYFHQLSNTKYDNIIFFFTSNVHKKPLIQKSVSRSFNASPMSIVKVS